METRADPQSCKEALGVRVQVGHAALCLSAGGTPDKGYGMRASAFVRFAPHSPTHSSNRTDPSIAPSCSARIERTPESCSECCNPV